MTFRQIKEQIAVMSSEQQDHDACIMVLTNYEAEVDVRNITSLIIADKDYALVNTGDDELQPLIPKGIPVFIELD